MFAVFLTAVGLIVLTTTAHLAAFASATRRDAMKSPDVTGRRERMARRTAGVYIRRTSPAVSDLRPRSCCACR